MKWLLFIFLLAGCEDTVDLKERVIFEDGSPVKGAKVYQWTDEGLYYGTTHTEENGTWTLTVPADVFINLCIENPREKNSLACYVEGYLITPTVESGENHMIKVDK